MDFTKLGHHQHKWATTAGVVTEPYPSGTWFYSNQIVGLYLLVFRFYSVLVQDLNLIKMEQGGVIVPASCLENDFYDPQT